MLTRAIPKSGEQLPVIGLGTWSTFDVGERAAERAPLSAVLQQFVAGGGALIDSSPMYGRAEEVVGALVGAMLPAPKLFMATKVWTTGKERGIAQMRASLQKMGVAQMDLMQIHNLLDWQVHLPTLLDWKAQGLIRYVGITHYAEDAFDQMERILRAHPIDFVQLPYSIWARKAEQRLLPAAAETGTAVLVMRPFAEGALPKALASQPLPPWAAEIECSSWSQVLLKFILAHPAVTCPIPATRNPEHAQSNMRAGVGLLPDAGMLKTIAALAQ